MEILAQGFQDILPADIHPQQPGHVRQNALFFACLPARFHSLFLASCLTDFLGLFAQLSLPCTCSWSPFFVEY